MLSWAMCSINSLVYVTFYDHAKFCFVCSGFLFSGACDCRIWALEGTLGRSLTLDLSFHRCGSLERVQLSQSRKRTSLERGWLEIQLMILALPQGLSLQLRQHWGTQPPPPHSVGPFAHNSGLLKEHRKQVWCLGKGGSLGIKMLELSVKGLREDVIFRRT